MRLIEALQTKADTDRLGTTISGPELADHVVKTVREIAAAKLDHIIALFPEYTDHSVSHSDSIVQILDHIVPDEVLEKLNKWEIYYLLCAAYLHDIGMIESCPPLSDDQNWQEYTDRFHAEHAQESDVGGADLMMRAKQNFVRDTHHERSERYIETHGTELGLTSSKTDAEAEIVGRISKGHRKVDLGNRSQFGEVSFGHGYSIRRDLLAAYLRLADELDTTAYRTPIPERDAVTIVDKKSALEWAKHRSISGITALNGEIRISGSCSDFRVFLHLKNSAGEIQNKLLEIKNALPRGYSMDNGDPLFDPVPYHRVDLQVEPKGFLPIEIKFKLSHQDVMRLLLGERLYPDTTVGIRELLQNAVDTCREAAEIRSTTYQPGIQVVEAPDKKTITVSDNGMGMDEHVVESYFARLGVSYYRSPEFHGNFRPTSEFGIGVLSCFMIAESVEVNSRREGSQPIWFAITSLSEPFLCKRGTRSEPGTDITLHLKPNAAKWDIIAKVERFARHVPVPIRVQAFDGRTTVVGGSPQGPSLDALLKYSKDILAQSFDLHDRYSDSVDLDEALKVECQEAIAKFSAAIEVDGSRLVATLFPGGWLYRVFEQKSPGNVRGTLYQDGFFVRSIEKDDISCARCSLNEVNLAGNDRMPLSIDRSRTIRATRGVTDHINGMYLKALDVILANNYEHLTPDRWWALHVAHSDIECAWRDPDFQERSLSQARFCVVDRSGARATLIHDLPKDHQVFVANIQQHEIYASLLDKLPEGVSILFLPSIRFDFVDDYTRYEHDLRIDIRSLAGFDVKYVSEAEILRQFDIALEIKTTHGQDVALFDAGRKIGPALVSIEPQRERTLIRAAWDIHHPITNLLLSVRERSMPETIRQAISHFMWAAEFRSSESGWHIRDTEPLQTWNEFLVLRKDLVDFSIIDALEAPDHLPADLDAIGAHSCAYGKTYEILVSADSGYPWRLSEDGARSSCDSAALDKT